MSNGVGMQNFSSNNLSHSGSYHKGDAHLEYTVQDGDTIDGDIATVVHQFGSDDLINEINTTYAKNQGFDAAKLTDDQKKDALLWFADVQSQNVAKASKIDDRNQIKAGDKLNLDSILNSDGTNLQGYHNGLDTQKIGFSA